jgi:hypothetical protein
MVIVVLHRRFGHQRFGPRATLPCMATSSPLAARLRQAGREILDLRGAVEAGRPWPLSDVFGVEPEAAWGPPEVLAHVAEMLPFWLGEIARVLDGADEPVPFGRVASDALRIGVIERDRSLPPGELFARIEAGVGRFADHLVGLDPADAERRGLHPRLGPMTVTQIAERFVVCHLEEHVAQLASVVGADAGGPGNR